MMGMLSVFLELKEAAWQQAIKGFVLLLAVAFDLINKRRGRR